MSMFPAGVDFVKVPKFVVKATNVEWDSYYNFDTNKWGGLLKASLLTKEAVDSKQMPANSTTLSYDAVIGQ